MGCLCKTFPPMVRVFTIVAFVCCFYMVIITNLPKCERYLDTGFIITNPCYSNLAVLDQYSPVFVTIRRFLEEYEDDCRGSYPSESALRGAYQLWLQSGVSFIFVSCQIIVAAL